MEKVESELHQAAAEVIAFLRQAKGLDAQSAARLKTALRTAAQAWANASVISKSAANLFVDLAPGIEACSFGYKDAEMDRIREFADEIADLVRTCVSEPLQADA